MNRYLFALTAALAVMLVGLSPALAGDCNVPICTEQGGARLHVGSGGSIDIQSGGDFDIEAGATFKIGGNEIQVELDILDGVTASTGDLNATTNFEETISATTSEVTIKTGKTLDITDVAGLKIATVAVTSDAGELNILDGVTASTADLNATTNFEETISATTSEVTIPAGKTLDITDVGAFQIANTAVTADATELNLTDGLSASTNDLSATENFEEVLSATTSELTILTGKTFDITDDGGLKLNNTSVSSTAAELNLLDGSLEANTVASVAPILDSAKALRTNANVGTAGTNVTAVEYGDGYNHVTVLTLTAVALTPTIPADPEGAGAIIYTFPAGAYMGIAAHMDITAGTMDSATNAADVGLGSFISSGDIVTLTTTAMEDWVTGQTVSDVSTFVTEKSTVMTNGANLMFELTDSHVLHINTAATWNSTVSTADVTGTVTIVWTFLGL